MLRIIDIDKHSLPCCVPVIDGVEFYPGMIAQNYNGKFGVSNGLAPCGLIDDIRCNFINGMPCVEDTVIASGKITIWNVPGIYQTDMFDMDVEINKNMHLYCNSRGVFSTIQPSIKYPVIGIVEDCSDDTLEFEYIKQDNKLFW